MAKKVPSSFNFLIPHSLFLVQYFKQLHVNCLTTSEAAGSSGGAADTFDSN
jgi:hypothetical protein